MILGTIIYLPQYYAYSQVELLLCDSLAIGIAKPSRVLHTSRFLMKGYKFQRFVLDLQLLPWYLLIWISFGIASISIFPYIYSSQIFFYQRLLEIKRRKSLRSVIKNQHLLWRVLVVFILIRGCSKELRLLDHLA